MKKYPRLTEENLEEIIDKLLKGNLINEDEEKVLLRFKEGKNQGFMRQVSDLKKDINKIQLTSGLDSLSKDILDLYTELMRQYPKTGPSSIFNGLIKWI